MLGQTKQTMASWSTSPIERIRWRGDRPAVDPYAPTIENGIENIDRRPNIRRLFNIAIRYDTPLEKVDQALSIIQGILDNHEGMDPELTPRVYFNEFNRDSLNIIRHFLVSPPGLLGLHGPVPAHQQTDYREFEQAGIQICPSESEPYTQNRPLHPGTDGGP
jgi:small-conductance mechanosensitive channel